MSNDDNGAEKAAPETAENGASLQRQLAAQHEDYLRLRADFDDYVKRTQRDAEQRAAAAKEAFIRDLLPILDDLERAMAAESTHAPDALYEGVIMTLQKMARLLKHHGIEAMDDLGVPFDPHYHEAVMVCCDPYQEDHTVLTVIERGYRRGDHVFRPARVAVNDLSRQPGGYNGR